MKGLLQLTRFDGVRLGIDVADVRFFYEITAEDVMLTRIVHTNGEMFDVTMAFDSLCEVMLTWTGQ